MAVELRRVLRGASTRVEELLSLLTHVEEASSLSAQRGSSVSRRASREDVPRRARTQTSSTTQIAPGASREIKSAAVAMRERALLVAYEQLCGAKHAIVRRQHDLAVQDSEPINEVCRTRRA